jgi:hypothetical protein
MMNKPVMESLMVLAPGDRAAGGRICDDDRQDH